MDTPMKRCSRGDDCVHPLGCWQPATTEHFYVERGKKDRLKSRCRACAREQTRQWQTRNADKVRERRRRRRAENADKARAYARSYYAENVGKAKERNRRYYTENTEKVRGIQRRYRAENSNKVKESNRRYRVENSDKKREYDRRYRTKNADKRRMSSSRYRTKKRFLPDAFTAATWQRALSYFNGCCAYCGNQQDFWHIIEADHLIPLSSPLCPGTISTNIIPACKSCNTSKSDNDPIDWLNRKFGKRKAAQILKRVNAYFEWVREQGDVYDKAS